MSRGSSSSQSNPSTNQADNRVVVGEGGINAASGANVQVTDSGAIDGALGLGAYSLGVADSLAKNGMQAGLGYAGLANSLASSLSSLALGSNVAVMDRSLTTVDSFISNGVYTLDKLFSGALDTVKTSNEALSNAYSDAQGRGAFTDKLLLAAIAGVVVIGVFAIKAK